MKNFFLLIIALVLVMGIFSGCSLTSDKPYSNYTEVCNTEEYYERPLSLPVGFQNFSMGKYMEFYASYNGSICKFTDAGELRITYEDTLGFSAPYYYDGYIYAVSNGCLYQINSGLKGGMTQIGEKMDGTGANCVAINDSFALITLHHYDEDNKFSLKLMRVDLATGEATELGLGTEQRIYCSAGGVMYIYTKEIVDREEVYSLYEIPTDGEPIYICDMTDVGATPCFVLENGYFYYADISGNLCAKSMANGEVVKCVSGAGIYGGGSYYETGMVFCQGNIVYYNINTGCVESYYTPNVSLKDKRYVTVSTTKEGEDISHIDFQKLGEYSDLNVKYLSLTEEEMTIKLLAGDTDVDIYFISPTTARTLLDKNIYTPIESEIIEDFNDSCFDYISEYCETDNGDIALMPIASYVYGIIYPLEAAEEVGFTKEDLMYYDSFMDITKNHGSARNAFQTGDAIFLSLHAQYGKYYCNFDTGEFDYTSDVYKKFYSELLNYIDYSAQEHSLFKNKHFYIDPRYPEATIDAMPPDAPSYYPDVTLYTAGLYDYYSHATYCPTFFTEWGAAPMPRISEQVTGNLVNVEFAYINPYSNNKEAAVKLLEDIAKNFMNVRGGDTIYSFILEDKSAYAKDYRTESQVFNDFYDIAADGFIYEYDWASSRIDYMKARVTADEALANYQRQIEIWLNE